MPSPAPPTASVDSLLRQRESLREVIEEISSELELRPLLTSIVRHACELLGAWDGSIGLLDEARRVFRTEAIYRMPESELGAEMGPGVGLAGQVLATGRPVVLERYDMVERPIVTELSSNAVLGMPIFWRDRLIGFFGVGAPPPHRFSPGDVLTLGLFARHAAIAIENARLYERARQMAALEERTRLARDLHDSVTQKLFILSLIAHSVEAAWRRDPEEGARRTARLVELSGTALSEMRGLLTELRPAVPEPAMPAPPASTLASLPRVGQRGLLAALKQLVADTGRDGLKVELVPRGYTGEEAAVEENLYRIAQEALSNVAKHARAREATVLLAKEGRRIELRVVDDGVGFDPVLALAVEAGRAAGAPRWEGAGLGLVGMRERAALLNGRLSVLSRPGGGTIVKVVVHQRGRQHERAHPRAHRGRP